MSSRARRRQLLGLREEALLRSRIPLPPDETFQSLADWHRWLRSSFRSIKREPLKFQHIDMGEKWSLHTIQLRNRAMFDILRDDLAEWPYPRREDDPRLLLRERYDEAVKIFEEARDFLEDYRTDRRSSAKSKPDRKADPIDIDWTPGVDYCEYYDFPAWLKQAARILSRNSMALSQHGDGEGITDGDHLRVARKVLMVDLRVSDDVILALLALCAANEACELILASSRQASELLWDMSGRRDYNFVLHVLDDAKRWLLDAHRLGEQKEEQSRRSAAGGSVRKTSEPIREFAQLLRNENPDKSVKWLFDTAVKRVRRGLQAGETPINIGDCMLEIEDERAQKVRLIATKEGERVGAAAGLSAWQSWDEARKRST